MVLDFVYSMENPSNGITTFTNSPEVAEGYSRAGWKVLARSNTGNGSKVFKYARTTDL